MKFTEEKLEHAFIELLGKQGFPHFTANAIVRAADEVLIEADLLAYLMNRYEQKKLTATEAKSSPRFVAHETNIFNIFRLSNKYLRLCLSFRFK